MNVRQEESERIRESVTEMGKVGSNAEEEEEEEPPSLYLTSDLLSFQVFLFHVNNERVEMKKGDLRVG
jgi:hypothetical protein